MVFEKIHLIFKKDLRTFGRAYYMPDYEYTQNFLCSHLMLGFAGLNRTGHIDFSLDSKGKFDVFVGKARALKRDNKELKVLLSIGGKPVAVLFVFGSLEF